MKTKKSLFLLLVAVFMFTACKPGSDKSDSPDQSGTAGPVETTGGHDTGHVETGGGEDTGHVDTGGGDGSGNVETSVVPVEGWTAEQVALMEDKLDGYVLPYLEIPGAVIEYDEEYECISIYSNSEGANLALVSDVVELYEAEGYAVIDMSPEDKPKSLYDLYYDDDNNMVNAQCYYMVDPETNETLFEIDVYLWPITAWPEEDLKDLPDALPAPADSERVFCYFDAYEQVNLFVLGADPEKCEQAYKEVLIANNYEVEDPAEGDTWYFAASEREGTLCLFRYDADLECLHIIVAAGDPIVNEWPAEAIASLFDESLGIDIPVFANEAGYRVVDYSLDPEEPEKIIDIQCVDTASKSRTETVDVYRDALLAKGYQIVDLFEGEEGSDVYGICVANDYFEHVSIMFTNYNLFYEQPCDLIIEIEATESPWTLDQTSYPEEIVKKALKEGSELPPAYNVVNGNYNYKAVDNGVLLRVLDNTGSAIGAYMALLENEKDAEGKPLWNKKESDPLVDDTIVYESADKMTIISLKMDKVVDKIYLSIEITNLVTEAFINMAAKDQLVGNDGDLAIWEQGPVNVKIAKGESAQTVGNGTFMPDTEKGYSRLYKDQVVTVSVDEGYTLGTIVINADPSKGGPGSVPDEITGATVVKEGNTVTITPNEGVNEISFILTGQLRVIDLTVGFNLAA